MLRKLIILLLAFIANAQFFPPGTADSGNVSNMVLVYLDERSLPPFGPSSRFYMDSSKYQKLLRHDSQLTAASRMFDSVLLLGIDWYGKCFCDDGPKCVPMNKTDWSSFGDLWWQQGANEISKARLALNDSITAPPTKIFVTIPYPNPQSTSFGEIGGRYLNFSRTADRIAACTWWVDQQVQRYQRGKLPGIALAGFYWYMEYLPPRDYEVVRAVTRYVHSRYSLKVTWIPFYDAAVISTPNYQKLWGFDFVTIQPNFAFINITENRFFEVSTLMSKNNCGVEMEMPIDGVFNHLINEDPVRSFYAYLNAANKYDWKTKALKTFYFGNDFVVMANSRNATIRGMYDALHVLLSLP